MKWKYQKAFTLLEIMVAMAIFSVVVIAIYSSWTSIVRGAKLGQEAAAAAQRSRIAMRTIEDALSTAQVYQGNIQHYSFIADTSDPEFTWLSFTSHLPGTFLGSGFYGNENIRRVTFSVESGEDGVKQLMMYQMPILRLTNSDSMYSISLARDVSLFLVEFWDTQRGEWTDELLTTNQLPRLIRVSLGIGEKKPDITSRVIAPASIAVPVEVQRPRSG